MAEETAEEAALGGVLGTKDVGTVLQQAVQQLEELPDASPLREQQRRMPASPPAPPQNSPAMPAPPLQKAAGAAVPAPEQRQVRQVHRPFLGSMSLVGHI